MEKARPCVHQIEAIQSSVFFCQRQKHSLACAARASAQVQPAALNKRSRDEVAGTSGDEPPPPRLVRQRAVLGPASTPTAGSASPWSLHDMVAEPKSQAGGILQLGAESLTHGSIVSSIL
jgi:hypothetical protein